MGARMVLTKVGSRRCRGRLVALWPRTILCTCRPRSVSSCPPLMFLTHIWVVLWVGQAKGSAGVPGLPSTSLPVKPELTDRGTHLLLLQLDTLIHMPNTFQYPPLYDVAPSPLRGQSTSVGSVRPRLNACVVVPPGLSVSPGARLVCEGLGPSFFDMYTSNTLDDKASLVRACHAILPP